MKNLLKMMLTLALVLSLVLSATSCELLAEHGIDLDQLLGGEVSGDVEDDADGSEDGGAGDATEDENDPPSHNHTYVSEIISATCTESGRITYTCECGKSFYTDTAPKGHEYVKDTCTVCGYVDPDYEEELPPEPEVFEGGIIYLPKEDDPVTSDPYVGVDVTEFYANYTPAISYMDSYYRTQHNLMSGSIATQSAHPTISAHQPELDGMLVRNTTYLFSEDGLVYYVVDSYGNIVNKIYKCGAYVTLEEVAAYVFAFGTFPANHSASKSTKPSSSPWGKYLRVNHTNFTGDTSRYPYEPELPNITGCGGDLYYYEMDIGTASYNNGSKISRGACRIVYTRKDLDKDGVIEINETYLFYTENHYHDFREYLNYEGGWGVLFGDEAGGGVSRPTPYPETSYYSFVYADGTPIVTVTEVVVLWMPKREEI
jgi:hypothetical protein